jgi:hypothetical protein
MTSTRISRAGWAVALIAAFGLAGCGSSSDSASKAEARNKKATVHVSLDPSKRPTADMIAGVTLSKYGPPVELKYELRGAPQAGQPLDVDIAVLSDVATVSRIYAKFQGGQGLELVEGGELTSNEKPAPGTPIRHVVRFVPKADGIYTVSATVGADLPNESVMRTYYIPVIVGEGLPDDTAKAEAAPAASGTVGQSGALKTH